MLTASEMHVKVSQKQAKGKNETSDALLCVCFALRVGRESCHILRFALYGVALRCSWEGEAVTRYGLRWFALFRFVLVCSCEGEAATCYGLICTVLVRFASHCSTLLALHC